MQLIILGKTNVLGAEATALRAGLQAYLFHGHRHVHVEGDSKILIDSVIFICTCPHVLVPGFYVHLLPIKFSSPLCHI